MKEVILLIVQLLAIAQAVQALSDSFSFLPGLALLQHQQDRGQLLPDLSDAQVQARDDYTFTYITDENCECNCACPTTISPCPNDGDQGGIERQEDCDCDCVCPSTLSACMSTTTSTTTTSTTTTSTTTTSTTTTTTTTTTTPRPTTTPEPDDIEYDCGTYKIKPNRKSIFKSPNYPDNYGKKSSCTWKFTCSNKNGRIELRCTTFKTESAKKCKNADYLYIRDDTKEWGYFCGKNSQAPDLKTKDNKLVAKFVTNKNKKNAKGFRCLATCVV